MTIHLGNVPASSTLYIPFATYAGSTGASATCTGLAVTDIEIYKNGLITQRSSDAGYTLLDTDGIDFDGLTGIHGLSIDLSDNTDSGFFSVGGFYWVVVSSITVDSQTVNFIAATFRIVAAEAITGKPKVDVDGWLGTACATPTVAGVPEVDLTHVGGAMTNVAALATNVDAILTDTGTTLDGKIDAILLDTAEIGAAGAGLTEAGGTGDQLTALATAANLAIVAGYLDTEIAAILEDTGTTIPTQIAALNNLSAAQVNAEVDAALADIHLDHLLAATYDPASKPGTADALLNELVESDSGVSRFTANALEQGPGGGGGGLTQQNIEDIASEVVANLAGQEIEIVSPYPTGGTVRTTQNTAYKNTLGNRIEWGDVNEAWPVLTGATVTVKIGQGGTPLTFTGAVITATGAGKRVGVELEEADTLSIDETSSGSWDYIVTATISGDVLKLADGKWISVEQPA